jgi:integrase
VVGSLSLDQLESALRRVFTRATASEVKTCPTCAARLSDTKDRYEYVTHNPETCRLVNLVLSELGVRISETVRIQIYPGAGPLRGFYFTGDPYTIHISEEAYAQLLEYIIFHETKHLVDCLRFGRSEELTPDSFARSLCLKYGYRCPPEYGGPWFAYA